MAEAHEIPGAYVRDLVELVARWKIAGPQLLEGLPLTVDALREPATRVPIAVCEQIVARALRLTGEPALALHLGMQMRLSSHGFVGFAAMTAGTLREAISLATRYAATRTTALGLALYVEGDTASVVIDERAPLGGMREFAVLGLIAGLWQLAQALTGRALDGTAECSFPAPAYLDNAPAVTSRIRFGCPANRLVFSSALLDTPFPNADPVAMQLARDQCERELASVVDRGLPGRVRAAILARSAIPTIGELARELHVSTRTLKRKLAEHDTTFSEIVDEVRRQRALLLLDNRELSVGEVATRVGYRELPSFTRAFRKWTGMTPAAYRGRDSR